MRLCSGDVALYVASHCGVFRLGAMQKVGMCTQYRVMLWEDDQELSAYFHSHGTASPPAEPCDWGCGWHKVRPHYLRPAGLLQVLQW